MIVSASRRTDVPAFYAPWLLRRLREGYADVANPFAPGKVRRVDLRSAPGGSLEILALWTRRPGPLLAALPEWEESGLRSLWAVTITGYPELLEPAAPPKATALAELRALASVVGPERVVWRYDPLLLCPSAGVDATWHRRNFREIASALAGSTGRCVLSLYDDYAKARKRLAAAGLPVLPDEASVPLAGELRNIAGEHGIELHSCCEELETVGIPPGACIDGALIDRLWGLGLGSRTDPGQRKGCRCAPSVDLGAYDTCLHGCLYCYATRSEAAARQRHDAHHSDAERLA